MPNLIKIGHKKSKYVKIGGTEMLEEEKEKNPIFRSHMAFYFNYNYFSMLTFEF